MFSQACVSYSVHGWGSAFPQCLGKENPEVRKTPIGKADPTPHMDTMGYGQQADGVHPTRMFVYFFVVNDKVIAIELSSLLAIVAKISIYRWQHWYHFKMFSTGAILVESAFYYFIHWQTE